MPAYSEARATLPLLVRVQEPPEHPVLPASLGLRQLVKLRFLAQLQIAPQMLFGQLVPLDRCAHRAIRLASVTAVRVAAARRQRVDVGEGLVDALAGAQQPQLAHSRHVDQQCPVPEHDQVPPRGGVTPPRRCG
ncbi:MAG: hypothetical protein M5U30_18910 [Burkholderiaceae bacterium]|nr:hypothetical protein [Burkholderiaceae bacterium]